jgi:general secretion pathway protein A
MAVQSSQISNNQNTSDLRSQLAYRTGRLCHGTDEPDMYKRFFGLLENPFSANPGPRYIFLTPQTRRTLEEMVCGLQARTGLVLLTGEAGTGKTTLINQLIARLHQTNMPTAFIFNSRLEISQLFDFILADFKVPADSQCKDNSLLRLNRWLVQRYRAGDSPVLIIDEAQGLPVHVLEEIRLLLNLEAPREKLLQIVLSGQPELEDRLRRTDLRQLKQRITLRCKTAALTLVEARDYIQVRLLAAGATGEPIFDSEALDAAHFYSRGIPRVMNLLCENALINAYGESIRPVPMRIVADVARKFQFDDIRPVSPFKDPADRQSANSNAMKSAIAGKSIHGFASDDPFFPEEHPGACTSGASGDTALAEATLGAPSQAAPTTADAEVTSDTAAEVEKLVVAASSTLLDGYARTSADGDGRRSESVVVPGPFTRLLGGGGFERTSASLLPGPNVEAKQELFRVATSNHLPAPDNQKASPLPESAAPPNHAAARAEEMALLGQLRRPLQSPALGFASNSVRQTCVRATETVLRRLKEPMPFAAWRNGFLLVVSPTARQVREVSYRWLRQLFRASRMFGLGAVWVTRKRGSSYGRQDRN